MGSNTSKEMRSSRLQHPGNLPEKTSRLVELSHGSVHYFLLGEENKEKPLFVLVHDFAGDTSELVEVGKFMQSVGKSRVLCFDLYGRGFSSDDGHQQHRGVFAGQIAELLYIINEPKPVHLVGYGYGAAIALRFATVFPDKVLSLIMIAPLVFNEIGKVYEEVASKVSLFHSPSENLCSKLINLNTNNSLSWKNPNSENVTDFLKRQAEVKTYKLALKRSITSSLDFLRKEGSLENEMRAVAKSSHINVLAIYVKNDNMASFTKSSYIEQIIKRAKIIILEDYHHSFPIEVPEVVGTEILNFAPSDGLQPASTENDLNEVVPAKVGKQFHGRIKNKQGKKGVAHRRNLDVAVDIRFDTPIK